MSFKQFFLVQQDKNISNQMYVSPLATAIEGLSDTCPTTSQPESNASNHSQVNPSPDSSPYISGQALGPPSSN